MIEVVSLPEANRSWLAEILTREWGSVTVVSRGKVHNAAELPALLATWKDSPAAVLTYRIEGIECEIVTLNSVIAGRGAGSALLRGVQETAHSHGCRWLRVITTNDNTDALAFYQRRGFCLRAVYPRAINEARRLKPEIPLVGRNGIPIRDEVELELEL